MPSKRSSSDRRSKKDDKRSSSRRSSHSSNKIHSNARSRSSSSSRRGLRGQAAEEESGPGCCEKCQSGCNAFFTSCLTCCRKKDPEAQAGPTVRPIQSSQPTSGGQASSSTNVEPRVILTEIQFFTFGDDAEELARRARIESIFNRTDMKTHDKIKLIKEDCQPVKTHKKNAEQYYKYTKTYPQEYSRIIEMSNMCKRYDSDLRWDGSDGMCSGAVRSYNCFSCNSVYAPFVYMLFLVFFAFCFIWACGVKRRTQKALEDQYSKKRRRRNEEKEARREKYEAHWRDISGDNFAADHYGTTRVYNNPIGGQYY